MSKRAVIYARVSSNEQRSNYSIPSQVRACQEYIEMRDYSLIGDLWVNPENGFDAVEGNGAIPAYVDDYSSLEISRPSLDAAIRFMDTTGFDVLVVYSIDRLARDPYMRKTLELELENRDAWVEYVQGQYDDSPEGEVRKDMEATFGKWENAKRVERTNRGKRESARKGNFIASRAPYGYIKDNEAPSGLAIDKATAGVIRSIYRLYVDERLSYREIADRLTNDGIQTHQGEFKWSNTSIARILSSETYVGTSYYGRDKIIKGKRIRQPRSEWIAVKVPALIDSITFDAAQKRKRHNRLVKRQQPSRFYLLSGLVFCADCCKPYVAQTSKIGRGDVKIEHKTYRERADKGGCRNHQVAASHLEPAVWKIVQEIVLDPEMLKSGYQDALQQRAATRSKLRDRTEQLEVEAERIQTKLNNLLDAYLDPAIGMKKAEYLQHKDRLVGEKATVLERFGLVKTETLRATPPVELETLDRFTAEIREIFVSGLELSPQEKRKTLDLLDVKVLIDEERHIRIEGMFGRKTNGLENRTS